MPTILALRPHLLKVNTIQGERPRTCNQRGVAGRDVRYFYVMKSDT